MVFVFSFRSFLGLPDLGRSLNCPRARRAVVRAGAWALGCWLGAFESGRKHDQIWSCFLQKRVFGVIVMIFVGKTGDLLEFKKVWSKKSRPS